MASKKGNIEHELSELFFEFVVNIREEDADELALRVLNLLRQKGIIIPTFSTAPKYILMMELEDTPQIRELEERLNNPEYNLKIHK